MKGSPHFHGFILLIRDSKNMNESYANAWAIHCFHEMSISPTIFLDFPELHIATRIKWASHYYGSCMNFSYSSNLWSQFNYYPLVWMLYHMDRWNNNLIRIHTWPSLGGHCPSYIINGLAFCAMAHSLLSIDLPISSVFSLRY